MKLEAPWRAFVDGLNRDEAIRKLEYGVPAGYAVIVGFVLIAALFWAIGLMPQAPYIIFGLAPIKFIVRTVSWWALRRKHPKIMSFAVFGQAVDILLLTGVVYFTGGPTSPFLSFYFIALAITGTMTDVGVTATTAVLMFVSYVITLILMSAEIIPIFPAFLSSAYHQEGLSVWFVGIESIKMLFMLGILVTALTSALRLITSQQNQLVKKNEELIEASRLKNEFVANVTHELRTPIHGVLGLTEMIEEGIYGDVTARQETALQGIRTSAENLLHIVDDLLSFERVNKSRVSVSLKGVDIQALLVEIKQSGEWMAGKKALTIENTGTRVFLMASDPFLLQHILTNLVSNAIKFTPEGGRITLDAVCDGQTAVLTVQDNGIGIPPEFVETIWEPFRQVDGSSSRQFGGVGLGLTVVAQYVDMLKAKIEVQSTPQGTTFTLRIPGAMAQR